MNTTNQTPRFKIIQIINVTFIIGVVLFSFFTLKNTPQNFSFNDGSLFVYSIPLLSMGSILLGNLFFNKSISAINKSERFYSKLTKYQLATIIRASFLEVSGLIATVVTGMTTNFFYFMFTVFSIIIILVYMPSKNKFKRSVPLNSEELSKLNNM